MATTALRFADSFWDEGDHGIDILTDKLTNSEQTCQDLKKIYEIRAQIEKDYGERLLELSHYTLGEIELGTLATSMQRIPFAFETTARAHIDMAEQLNTTLGVPLTSFLKEQGELINARSHQMENSKHLKDIHQAHVEKAKLAHDDVLALLRQKQENGEDTETVNNSLALADREWQHSVEILQEVTDKFTLDWKITCDLYQDLEERRINFIRSNVWAFANMMSSVYIVDDRGCEEIRTGLEATDVRQDINDFILKYGTSVKLATTTTVDLPRSTRNGSTPIPSATIDTMSSVFQEVEDMLSDPGVTKRNSQDQQSIHSNRSTHHPPSSSPKPSFSAKSGHSKGNQSNTTTPRGSVDSTHRGDQHHQHQHQHQHQTLAETATPNLVNADSYTSPTSLTMHSPPKLTSSVTATSEGSPTPYPHSQQQPSVIKSSSTVANNYSPGTERSPPLDSSTQPLPSNSFIAPSTTRGSGQGQRHPANNSDSDSDDGEPKRPIRTPKPREEKWTISARRTGPSATSRPTNRTTNTNTANGNNGNPRSTTPTPSNQVSVIQPPSANVVANKPAYLDPSVHPPPLQQQQQQQQQQPYYGVSQSQQSTLYPPENYTTPSSLSSKRNSHSSFYLQAPSASSSASSLNLDAANQKPATTYTPSSNLPTSYLPSATSGHYQPTTTTSSYRPIVPTYQPAATDPSSVHQPPTGIVPAYRPATSTYQPHAPSTYIPHPPSSMKSNPSNSAQEPPLANPERLAQQPGLKIGIRPPEWQDQRQGELEGTAATEYMKGEGAPTSPARSGLSRYNSVNGPREPPPKDNYIASADLKNTRGYGQETVTILEEDSMSIHDMNNKKKDDPVDDTTTTSTTITTTENATDPSAPDPSAPDSSTTDPSTTEPAPPTQEAPKSGFSFNNIFFRKDKAAAADDGLRLPDGTVYKHKVRAMWSYEAKIDSELSFQANDSLAVIRKQPDGWWEAEILDDKRRQRGLVPGNYMSLN
ncbi:hypothetical protein [Absidia glauca]|uniref:SH3 domain-containing protein n=1 Tax=Absidia glauca TaxID=4829 RepID=A0A163J6E1_ABSGL|nr:hypothetical protein [Absidia glauca]